MTRQVRQAVKTRSTSQTAEHFRRRAFVLPSVSNPISRVALRACAQVNTGARFSGQVQTVSSLCIIISFCKMALNEYLSICGASSANENFDRRADSCQGSHNNDSSRTIHSGFQWMLSGKEKWRKSFDLEKVSEVSKFWNSFLVELRVFTSGR